MKRFLIHILLGFISEAGSTCKFILRLNMIEYVRTGGNYSALNTIDRMNIFTLVSSLWQTAKFKPFNEMARCILKNLGTTATSST